MNKGLIVVLVLLFSLPVAVAGEIYKVVDKDGKDTYTDQRPAAGAEPMDLPPLSVVETEKPPAPVVAAESEGGEAGEKPLTAREMRRLYKDFRIIQPQNEETFWGTANTVVVSWGTSQALPDDMRAVLYVNGKPQDVPGAGSVSLTLERGEHSVYVELRDGGNRRVTTTETVTFFVKQHSANFGVRRSLATPQYGF